MIFDLDSVSMYFIITSITLWSFNIAMENCQFSDVFSIKVSIYDEFSIAMRNNQMLYQ